MKNYIVDIHPVVEYKINSHTISVRLKTFL